MREPILSVDLGGTRMRAAIVMPDGEVVERRSQPTPQDAECPDALVGLAGDVLESGDVARAVIGVPGRVRYATGQLEHAPNLPPHWAGALDEAQLTERLGIPVSIANDADLAAVGEAYFGAGRGYHDVAYLTVSTGVGAGVLFGGRLVAGRRSSIELGHTVIDLHAASEGRPATVEGLGSGTALERRAEAVGLPADGALITELVRAGHEDARALWDRTVQAVAAAVTNVAYLFTPQVIVLGGAVGGNNGDLLLGPLHDHLDRAGPPDLPEPIALAVTTTGDDAGLVGGAAWEDATGRNDQPAPVRA